MARTHYPTKDVYPQLSRFTLIRVMEQVDEVKRAVRTAQRSIEAATASQPKEESCQHMADAIQQLAFAVDKLIDLMRLKPGQD